MHVADAAERTALTSAKVSVHQTGLRHSRQAAVLSVTTLWGGFTAAVRQPFALHCGLIPLAVEIAGFSC